MIKPKKVVLAALVTAACAGVMTGCASSKPTERQGWLFHKASSYEHEKVIPIKGRDYKVSRVREDLVATPKTFAEDAGSLQRINEANQKDLADSNLSKEISTMKSLIKAAEVSNREHISWAWDNGEVVANEISASSSEVQTPPDIANDLPTLESNSVNSGSNNISKEKSAIVVSEQSEGVGSLEEAQQDKGLPQDEVSPLIDKGESETILLDDGLITSFKINSSYLQKAQQEAIKSAMADAIDSGVKKVVVVGYASPDGPYEFNKALSKRRATSTAKFITDNFADLEVEIQEAGGGEFLKDRAARVFLSR